MADSIARKAFLIALAVAVPPILVIQIYSVSAIVSQRLPASWSPAPLEGSFLPGTIAYFL